MLVTFDRYGWIPFWHTYTLPFDKGCICVNCSFWGWSWKSKVRQDQIVVTFVHNRCGTHKLWPFDTYPLYWVLIFVGSLFLSTPLLFRVHCSLLRPMLGMKGLLPISTNQPIIYFNPSYHSRQCLKTDNYIWSEWVVIISCGFCLDVWHILCVEPITLRWL